MKTITLILAAALLFSSCTKQTIEQNRPTANYSNMSYSPAYAGSSVSIKFTFTLSAKAQKINLYRVPEVLVYYINNPNQGSITMYDHLVDAYPTYSQNYFYQLEFILADGSIIRGEKFQVY